MSCRRLCLVAAAVPLLLSTASPALAGRLPDWAASLAASAPEVPAGVGGGASRVLLSELQYVVQPDGTYRVRRRLAVQALSVETRNVSTGYFAFDESSRITATRAWHLPPDDSARKTRSMPMDVAIGDSFLSGSKARTIPVEGVKKGSLLFFEFEAVEKPYFLNLTYRFFEGAPVSLARLELQLPPGWKERSAWIQGKGPEPVLTGATRIWEMRDLPEPVEEDLAPNPVDAAPLLGINLLPPEGSAIVPVAFPDWAAVSQWYEELSRDRRAVSPSVEAAAKQAQSAGDSPVPERLLAAATLVRDRVRYVDVELGIGGFQPRAATETLARLYGDCKDKGTLLEAILRAGGITSYPVLVNLGAHGMIPEDVPVWNFNHLVVAVSIPPGSEPPARFAPSRLEDEAFGRLILVDSTDEFTSVGSLSAGLAGQKALLAAGPKGKLITLPQALPSTHRLEQSLDIKLLPDGGMAIDSETRSYGELAAVARHRDRESSVQHQRDIEKRWSETWADAVVEHTGTQYETADGAFVEKVTVKRPPGAMAGEAQLPFFPGAGWDIPRVPLGRRKLGVDYSFPRQLVYKARILGIPAESPLPPSKALKGDGWEGASSFRREGDAVEGTAEIRLSRTRFEPEAFPELRKFWSAVSTLEGLAVAHTR